MKHTFGPFSFDTTTRELRRNGDVVKLQSQPAQVLAVLVEHAGEIVTRETLRQAIWGDDTFVDFDKGLNFAIAQVRTALGDSADNPTYIRTHPKRGYQFIPTVDNAAAMRDDAWRRASALRTRSPEGLRHDRLWMIAAAAVVVLSIGAWAWTARERAAVAHTIAVARFDNQTGVADYDRYAQNLTDSLVAELTASGSGRFSIIGNAAALRLPRDQRDLVAIGRALNARYIVFGQVQREGNTLRVLAHLIRLPEQTHLWVTRVETPVEDAPVAASSLARRITTEFLGKL